MPIGRLAFLARQHSRANRMRSERVPPANRPSTCPGARRRQRGPRQVRQPGYPQAPQLVCGNICSTLSRRGSSSTRSQRLASTSSDASAIVRPPITVTAFTRIMKSTFSIRQQFSRASDYRYVRDGPRFLCHRVSFEADNRQKNCDQYRYRKTRLLRWSDPSPSPNCLTSPDGTVGPPLRWAYRRRIVESQSRRWDVGVEGLADPITCKRGRRHRRLPRLDLIPD